jgi:Ulp1 family protease
MPVNVGNRHWVLIVGNVRRATVGVIDSMKSEAYSIYTQILEGLHGCSCI